MSRQFFKNIGIESFGFYAPRFSLNIEELAQLRQVDPKKFTDGLLLREMRIPEVGEDIITMSLKASQNALLRGNIHPKQIDAIFVGTETVTYAVKSVSNIIAEILGVSVNSITQDIYNACAGATLALLNAVGLIESGVIKKALVIAADISSYKLGSPGESTQGAGASAIVISANPRLALFSKKFGKYSGSVNDFFRIVGDTDAQVFGKYSVQSYMKFQMGAFDDLIQNLGEFHANFYAFHAPFSKLPLKIMQNLLVERSQHFLTHVLNLNLRVPRSRITSRLPSIRYALQHFPSYITSKLLQYRSSKHLIDQLVEKASELKHQMFPHLTVPMHIGNMYSASVWAQIMYILENTARPGDVIYFGSYGSGATCISGLLRVMPGVYSFRKTHPTVTDYINQKIQTTAQEYEILKQAKIMPKVSLGYIEEHADNEHRGIELHFCDNGCLIPNISGLNHCPHGHPGFHKMFYPLYAVLVSDPQELLDVDDKRFVNNGLVRILGNPQKGALLEYNMRRIQTNVEESAPVQGLLNWAPTYVPVNASIHHIS